MAIVPWRGNTNLLHTIEEEEGRVMGGEEDAGPTLYEILHVQPDATPEELKKQRRRLALRYHPDKNLGDDSVNASEKMQQVNRAYEILSDPTRRQVYDMFGEEAAAMLQSGAVGEDIAKFLLLLVSPKLPPVVAAVSLLVFLILLACPLFIALRLDDTVTWNWFIAFLPVLFVTFIATIALVAIDVLLIWLGMPEEKEEEEDEEGMGERDGFLGEDQEKVRPFTTKEKIELLSNSVTVSLLLVFELLLCIRLDEYVEWSWWIIFFPLFLVFGAMTVKTVRKHSRKAYANRSVRMLHCKMGYAGFLLRNCNTTAMLLVTSLLFVVNLEYGSGEGDLGVDAVFSWWLVLLPAIAWSAGRILLAVAENLCFKAIVGETFFRRAWVYWRERAEAEEQGRDPDKKLDEVYGSAPTTLSISLSLGYHCVVFGCVLIFICLAAAWLSTGSVSAVVVFLPVFLTLCCFCSVCFCCALPLYTYGTWRLSKTPASTTAAEEAGSKSR